MLAYLLFDIETRPPAFESKWGKLHLKFNDKCLLCILNKMKKKTL